MSNTMNCAIRIMLVVFLLCEGLTLAQNLAVPASPTEAAVAPTEDQNFVFSPRGRRDPFEPPYSRIGSQLRSDKDLIGTRDTIARAAKLLDDLTQAAKTKNAVHFKTIYENLTRLLDTRFTAEELRIYAMEIGRRARQLKDEMGTYEQDLVIESVLQTVEKRILELQTQIQTGKFDHVKETYQTIVRELTGLNVTNDTQRQRRDELLLKAGRLVSQADAAVARELLLRAEKILSDMKEKLQTGQFEEVLTEFKNLQNRLGALELTDAQLKAAREKLLTEAAEISRQAEIAAVTRELKNAEGILAKMASALEANDLGTVNQGYQNIQNILKALKISDPSLSERKAELLDKAAAIDRSAKTRAEFMSRDIKIYGIAWSPNNPAAIINDRSYGEGDALDELTRIEKITQDRVVFKYKGESVAKSLTQ